MWYQYENDLPPFDTILGACVSFKGRSYLSMFLSSVGRAL